MPFTGWKHTERNRHTETKKQEHTANVNRQTTDKLLFSHAIITDENM